MPAPKKILQSSALFLAVAILAAAVITYANFSFRMESAAVEKKEVVSLIYIANVLGRI
ncbi:hypothetical protein [Hydrogenoanaerobacterium sp.]|uniref:hypothetical protein n=1 Tax=Hydrogenoanaerobacterium sp. TaxID=2953763 RepID=UPI00289C3439|nr:hypothetical protein [Hydrogenoanaerobacterium sp.]